MRKSRALILLSLSSLLIPAFLSPAEAGGGRRAKFRNPSQLRPTCVDARARRVPQRLRVLDCGCRERWAPGHYEVRHRKRDPGFYRSVWIPPRYETCVRFGRKVRVLVQAGYYRKVYRPGHYRRFPRKVWVPGAYVSIRRCRIH